MRKPKRIVPESADPIVRRLDALIRFFIEVNRPRPKGKEKFSDAEVARLLKSVEMKPTEIARLLGKKSATDVSQYLYPRKKKTQTNAEPGEV